MARKAKVPPANTSREAVALRRAAIAFGADIGEPLDPIDSLGMKLNRQLLTAALRYAEAAFGLTRALEQQVLDALNDPDCIQAPEHDEDRKVLARRIAEMIEAMT